MTGGGWGEQSSAYEYLGFRQFVGLVNVRISGNLIFCGAACFFPGVGEEMPLSTIEGVQVAILIVPESCRTDHPVVMSSPDDDLKFELIPR